MITGSDSRKPSNPVHDLFVDRWSPRALSGERIPQEDLFILFEAARWAPSSYNNQPWRILYAMRESESWPLFFDLLVEANKVWAKNAGALLLFVSKTTFDHNGKSSATHSFDTGAAWENLALQSCLLGYVAHGMEGFDYERAKVALSIPDGYHIEAMAAIGRPGDKESLPKELQEKEMPSNRKAISEIAFEGKFPST